MSGHVETVRTGRGQRDRSFAVQEPAARRGDVVVDRVVHHLVPEHDAVLGLVEELRFERVVEIGDDVGR